ncbi:MAG: pseudouridine synthase [Hyphomicrobiaceae bacterium]
MTRSDRRQAPTATSRHQAPARIAKVMASAGLCSRREAERWIEAGRVVVNGQTLTTPAVLVGPSDSVLVDGQPIAGPSEVRLWKHHKPRGRVTTHRDPEGRPTVFEALPAELPRVISIGRLDLNTEGLLLLTTSGPLARYLELPATGWLRRYRVRAKGQITQEALDRLAKGIEVDGIRYGPIEASLDSVKGSNCWLTIGIREGKNREVRRVLNHLGLDVNRLIRVSYGPFQLGNLAEGGIEEVGRKVIADQLPHDVAEELGLRARSPGPPGRQKRISRKS